LRFVTLGCSEADIERFVSRRKHFKGSSAQSIAPTRSKLEFSCINGGKIQILIMQSPSKFSEYTRIEP
jgi:hypothetical protein